MKQAMIFAAGLGTRLKPLTDTMPKALVRVGDKPLIEHVILKMKAAGFERIVVNVHHFSEQIVAYLAANDDFGLDIRVSDETMQLLETGGGLKKAAPLFLPDAPVLIHNVDILSNVDLEAFYDSNIDNDATLLVSSRKTKRYLLFDDEMTLKGWTNIGTGEVKLKVKSLTPDSSPKGSGVISLLDQKQIAHITPLPFGEGSGVRLLAFSGIHMFSPRLFPLLDNYPDKFGIMDFYLGTNAKIKGCKKGDLALMDVGKADTLVEAEIFLNNLRRD